MICSVCKGTGRVPGTSFICGPCDGCGEILPVPRAPAPPVEAAERGVAVVGALGELRDDGDGYGEHPLGGAI